MADFLRFLPLSARLRGDESAVSTDRRRDVDAVIASVLPQVSGPDDGRRFAADAGLQREWDAAGGDLPAFRAAVAERKRSIRVLARALAAALRVARRTGQELAIDPMIAGAVALHAQGAGPFERRAVVAGHTIRATDADWAFGTGPALEGPSLEIAGFLLGVTDTPPRAPHPGSGAEPSAGPNAESSRE